MKKINLNPHNAIHELIFQSNNLLIKISMMLFFVISLAVMSNIRIDMWPVPITLQTLGIFFIAFYFTPKESALTLLLYITAGLIGFGVFSGYGSGLTSLFGPTGGYLIGFVFCAIFVSSLVQKGFARTRSSVIFIMVLGNIIIYAFGLLGLYLYLDSTFIDVFIKGLIPFLIGDIIKILAAAKIIPRVFRSLESH